MPSRALSISKLNLKPFPYNPHIESDLIPAKVCSILAELLNHNPEVKATPSCRRRTLPATSSLYAGLVVPIPTLTFDCPPLIPFTEPNTRQLLQSTRVCAPRDVAFVNPFVWAWAFQPIKVFFVPDILLDPALAPKNELSQPVFVCNPARCPKKELPDPDVDASPDLLPKKELPPPIVLLYPDLLPQNVL